MHKFDSENIRRTGTGYQHNNSAPPAAILEYNSMTNLTESQAGEEVENKIKLVRSFARSFSPQF